VSDFPSGCLGKLPLHGDFIRYNAAGAEVQELDEWVQEGIHECYNMSGFSRAFDSAPTAHFIYRSRRSGRIVAGLFKPSVDRAGRRYPFMVYTVIDAGALGQDTSYLPAAMDSFMASAHEMLEFSASAINLNTFLAAFEGLRFRPDMVEARKQFARFVLANQAGAYFNDCFRHGDDPRRFAAVGGVVEGVGTRSGVLALRLPLRDSDAEAAFWLELARRFADGDGMPTLTFWNLPQGENPGRVHMAWGELSSRYFQAFVLPNQGGLSVRDLAGGRDAVDGRWIEYGQARFGSVLEDGSLKLSDLLQRLPRS
jgi:type VI secretion system protein ImpM